MPDQEVPYIYKDRDDFRITSHTAVERAANTARLSGLPRDWAVLAMALHQLDVELVMDNTGRYKVG